MERETRAAFVLAGDFGHRETKAACVSKEAHSNRAGNGVDVLCEASVNSQDLPWITLQVESLILAQSERWRQA